MEKTEMMIEFEQETGKQSAILKFMSGGQALEQKSYPKLGPYDYNMDYIAWLESKAKINYEAVETFQEIIRTQCDEISALKEKAEAYDRLMSGEPTAKEKIVDAIKAYRELCVCYRVGRQPSEKLFTRLKKADELLKTLEES